MNHEDPPLVMIAGPYSSGTRNQAEKDANLKKLNEIALQIFKKGYVPVIGVNNALPLINIAGESSFEEIMMPLSLALANKCDCCLRIGGPSKGADAEAKQFRLKNKLVYFSIDELPPLKSFAS
jgi:hypothetical protein